MEYMVGAQNELEQAKSGLWVCRWGQNQSQDNEVRGHFWPQIVCSLLVAHPATDFAEEYLYSAAHKLGEYSQQEFSQTSYAELTPLWAYHFYRTCSRRQGQADSKSHSWSADSTNLQAD